MASQSPITIPSVREQIAPEPAPGHVAISPESVLAPAVPVKRVIATAAASTAAFVALSVSPYAGAEPVTVQSGTGLFLLLTELFWLSAAAMGASFAMLLQAGLGTRGNEERSYGIQFVVGVLTGFILVAFVPIGELVGSTSLPQPTIALLGAFFASMAFRFLPGGRTPRENGGDNAAQEP
jgi:hypothetical protein